MGLFSRIAGLFGATNNISSEETVINPATGLIMNGAVDSAGNPYGMDLAEQSNNADLWASNPTANLSMDITNSLSDPWVYNDLNKTPASVSFGNDPFQSSGGIDSGFDSFDSFNSSGGFD